MTAPSDQVTSWLSAGLAAVEPERLVREALAYRGGTATVIAIGKAAPGMCRGAAASLESVDGLCVSDHIEELPAGIELLVGDHPTPGAASLEAGRRALEIAGSADLALVSGGGSSLCEMPRTGVGYDRLVAIHRSLLAEGLDIEEANLARSSLSSIKSGGLGPLPTYVLSDVAPRGPEFVASGPTIPLPQDPERVLAILDRCGVDLDPALRSALAAPMAKRPQPSVIEVIGDGRTAADAVKEAALEDGIGARVRKGWLVGPAPELVIGMLASSPPGVTVAAGEPTPGRIGRGRGGRNTHAALLAAISIAGSDMVFAALATDGVDGSSGAAGAVVDGGTLDRGGDPGPALAAHDSATYLERSGDLLPGGPTGTNVADLWVIWKPEQ
jgi:hydroxypyruvate reductase